MIAKTRPAEILLVEDDPADVLLTKEALKEVAVPHNLNVTTDGVEAIAFLRGDSKYGGATRPDLMLLDLNLPRKDGREVLAEVKSDPKLKQIPVVVFTASRSEQDIVKCYSLHANAYVIKPLSLDNFLVVVRDTVNFWLTTVTLPPGE